MVQSHILAPYQSVTDTVHSMGFEPMTTRFRRAGLCPLSYERMKQQTTIGVW